MRAIAAELLRWYDTGAPFALATVIRISGSAPLPEGSALALDQSGVVVGNVSGGCVDAAVVDACERVLGTGEAQLERFGYADPDGLAIGLTCGGELEVLVQRIDPMDQPELRDALTAITTGGPVAVAQVIAGREAELGRLHVIRAGPGEGSIPAGLEAGALQLLRSGQSGRFRPDDAARSGIDEVFVHVQAPPPRLLIFGAVDLAAELSTVGRLLGYRVTVCDARGLFATPARFPAAHEVVVDWPHRYLARTGTDARTAICVLSHDAKFDLPLLRLALRLPVGYLGALGSRRTNELRRQALLAAGVPAAQLERLRAPMGLDLGGRTAAETALSIAAELVAVTHGGTALPLTDRSGPIHAAVPSLAGRS